MVSCHWLNDVRTMDQHVEPVAEHTNYQSEMCSGCLAFSSSFFFYWSFSSEELQIKDVLGKSSVILTYLCAPLRPESTMSVGLSQVNSPEITWRATSRKWKTSFHHISCNFRFSVDSKIFCRDLAQRRNVLFCCQLAERDRFQLHSMFIGEASHPIFAVFLSTFPSPKTKFSPHVVREKCFPQFPRRSQKSRLNEIRYFMWRHFPHYVKTCGWQTSWKTPWELNTTRHLTWRHDKLLVLFPSVVQTSSSLLVPILLPPLNTARHFTWRHYSVLSALRRRRPASLRSEYIPSSEGG